MFDITHHVSALYRLASRHPAVPPGLESLVEGIPELGARSIVSTLLPIVAPRFDSVEGLWRCLVPRAARPESLSMVLSEAVAHWYVARHVDPRVRVPYEDFARAIALPDAAVRIATEVLRYDCNTIAYMFVVPERVAALRIRDVLFPTSSGVFPRFDVAV